MIFQSVPVYLSKVNVGHWKDGSDSVNCIAARFIIVGEEESIVSIERFAIPLLTKFGEMPFSKGIIGLAPYVTNAVAIWKPIISSRLRYSQSLGLRYLTEKRYVRDAIGL
jgi:hypothetical protein